MALTYSILDRTKTSTRFVTVVEVTIGTYATGGLAISANKCGLGSISAVTVSGASTLGYVPVWDRTNGKLQMFYGDNNNASDGPLIEVPDTTDLSAEKVVLTIYGV